MLEARNVESFRICNHILGKYAQPIRRSGNWKNANFLTTRLWNIWLVWRPDSFYIPYHSSDLPTFHILSWIVWLVVPFLISRPKTPSSCAWRAWYPSCKAYTLTYLISFCALGQPSLHYVYPPSALACPSNSAIDDQHNYE